MKVPIILTFFGVSLSNFPDPNSKSEITEYPVDRLQNNTFKNREFRTLGDVVIEKNDFIALGFEKQTTPRFGPGGRSFMKPPLIWNKYPKNGYFRVAVIIDRESFNPIWTRRGSCYELENFNTEYPKAVSDFKTKTGIELGFHKNDPWHQNPNKNDEEWNHAHWIFLTARSNQGLSGCSSFLGRKGNWRQGGRGDGEQQISLSCGCHFKNTIMHEIIHALGWTHEQNRADRDDVIEIKWENINQRMHSQFKKAMRSDDSGTPYDPQSVMHYHEMSFSQNRRRTMVSKTEIPVISSRETYDRNGEFQKRGLSKWDSYEINMQYDLRKHCESRGLKWQLWDYVNNKPKLDGQVVGSDGCGGNDKNIVEVTKPLKDPCLWRINGLRMEIIFNGDYQATKICDKFSGWVGSKNTLNLSKNNIKGLSDGVFQIYKFTRILKLQQTNLANIESRVFHDLPYLEVANFKINSLINLPKNLFSRNSRLKTLNLSDNKLKGELPTGIFVSSLKNLYLKNNPELVLRWNTFRNLRNANRLYVWNTKMWDSRYSHEWLCRNLVRNGQVKKCCYGRKNHKNICA